MTINNAKATTHACPARPTTKSVCPEGAGLIDNASAHESAHTPPQACAAPPSCATAQQPRESLPAQLAEGYEHLFKTHQRLLQLMELISSDSYAASFQSLGQYRAALLEEAGKHVFEWPKLDRPAKVGAGRFGKGVSARLVVEAAQRQYEYEVTPEKEAVRIARLDGLRHAALQPLLVGELVDALKATLLRLHAYLEAETPMPADSMEVLRDKIAKAMELYRALPGGEA